MKIREAYRKIIIAARHNCLFIIEADRKMFVGNSDAVQFRLARSLAQEPVSRC